MRGTRISLVFLLLTAVTLSGCTTTQSGAGIGTGIGALAGQIIGRDTTSTLLGAGAGALAGALAGDAYRQDQEQQAKDARLQQLEQQQAAARPAPRPQGSPITAGSTYQTDPTAGQLVNSTSWVVQVFINNDPKGGGSPTVVMNPGETRPMNLDVGQHRIAAQAYVRTQFGRRLVGRYDQVINVDPRQSGFRVQFSQNSFTN